MSTVADDDTVADNISETDTYRVSSPAEDSSDNTETAETSKPKLTETKISIEDEHEASAAEDHNEISKLPSESSPERPSCLELQRRNSRFAVTRVTTPKIDGDSENNSSAENLNERIPKDTAVACADAAPVPKSPEGVRDVIKKDLLKVPQSPPFGRQSAGPVVVQVFPPEQVCKKRIS